MAKATASGEGSSGKTGRQRGNRPSVARGGRGKSAVPAVKAVGRTLGEFLPLSPAEDKLLKSCRDGTEAQIADRRPVVEGADQNVRAAFLRFMLLGGDETAPLHENGIRVSGAVITEQLNLMGCSVPSVYFSNCLFSSAIIASSAQFGTLEFIKCYVPGIYADGSRFSGSFEFGRGSICRGPILLRGASVDRSLGFGGARIYNKSGISLNCDSITIGGVVNLKSGFRSHGKVNFLGATIAGGFSCKDGLFYNRRDVSITIGNSKIGGILSISDGFISVGEVRIMQTEIGGDLDCENSQLLNDQGEVLHIRSVAVKGGLLWRYVKKIDGIVIFNSCSVADLVDDLESWEKAGNLCLDGLKYDRISGSETPTAAGIRIKWLKHQRSADFGAAFWPQPWEHLVKVLREMGHVEDAKRVAIGKQLALRDAGLVGQRPTEDEKGWRRWKNQLLNIVHRAFHTVYGALAGFGYRPLKTVGWMALVWFTCGLVYQAAAFDGLVGPTNAGVYASARFERCGDGGQAGREHWTQCTSMPPEYTPFDPFVFSLDIILPLLDLKQETEWRPIVHSAGGRELVFGHPLRFLMWFEIFFGWVTSLLLVSALGRLVQKD